jgi:DNA-directed RNA polymerase subunit RPC12/RpoP
MLSAEKLKQNAVTSIRLGVEDFQLARAPADQGGDPERALSAVRNLFAGMLLLFKYGLATRVAKPEDIDLVLFNPPKQIIPHPNGKGGVQWRPVGAFLKQTIDVAGIKARFEAFKIDVDWAAMAQLQVERNNLEHLHPTKSAGAIAGFVAEMFPILQRFVVDELKEIPADFLGPGWKIMLEHREFFEARLQECLAAWPLAIPDGVQKYVARFRCEECGSPLVEPNEDGEEYECMACGSHESYMPQLVDLVETEEGGYNPFDGDEQPVVDCPQCDNTLFVVSSGECLWCDYELDHRECLFCGEGLGLDEQDNGGLCGYHAHQAGKVD